MFDFETQNAIGKKGETLVKKYYEAQTDNEGKRQFICRDVTFDDQMKGADLFIINNELGARYVEVKTDTQIKNTDNFALEIMIVQDNGEKKIGAALKTFADFLFYWEYPTSTLYYWNPQELVPYIIDWMYDNKYKIVEAQNKNFFSRTMLVPKKDLLATNIVKEITVSYHIVDEILIA
tara:strand:+ start:13920 stop:14453 length:534 start_codon:yes stop_codon:yes gene_type:complete